MEKRLLGAEARILSPTLPSSFWSMNRYSFFFALFFGDAFAIHEKVNLQESVSCNPIEPSETTSRARP
jgi:hypothetical protein